MVNKGIILSDFNITNLELLLINNYSYEIENLPYGTVHNWLLKNNSQKNIDDFDFIIIWTRVESIISSFYKKLKGENISLDEIIREVDEFSSLLLSQDQKQIFFPIWHLPNYYGNEINDLKDGGIQNILLRINLRFIENIGNKKNVILLNTSNWISKLGEKSFNEKSWYLAKVPYSIDLFKLAAKDIHNKISLLYGNVKKLIILDLDDTLWGGIVGDIGWESITLGGHDPIGEAFVDFQNELKLLKNKGFVLAIVSKNEEDTALNAIKNHPEMILKINDFVSWRINWKDKAENIIEIVDELNIGINSVVFIDDNPLERARVKEVLPEVEIVDLPKDKMLYRSVLLEQPYFDKPQTSLEDLNKTELFISEKKRKKLKNKLGSISDWLTSIDIRVDCKEFNESDINRIIQLFNKTNQMNLSTRRLIDTDLINWLSYESRKLWTFRVSDKFGDSGLVGIVSIEIKNDKCNIIDFILSCRVFGRQIENIMIFQVVEYCLKNKINKIDAIYNRTEKNKPCYDFFINSVFDKKNNVFSFQSLKSFKKPNFIEFFNQK